MPRKDDQQIYRHPRERKGDPGSQYGAGFKGNEYHKERGTDPGGVAYTEEASAGYRNRQSYSPGQQGFSPAYDDDAGYGGTGGEEEKKKPAPRKKPQKH